MKFGSRESMKVWLEPNVEVESIHEMNGATAFTASPVFGPPIRRSSRTAKKLSRPAAGYAADSGRSDSIALEKSCDDKKMTDHAEYI